MARARIFCLIHACTATSFTQLLETTPQPSSGFDSVDPSRVLIITTSSIGIDPSDLPGEELIRTTLLSNASYYSKGELAYDPTLVDILSSQATGYPMQFDGRRRAGSQGYAWLFPLTRSLYLSFRGTDNVLNGLADVDIFMTNLADSPAAALVHAGFAKEYMSLEPEILSVIDPSTFDRIVLTGHSLGGAMATIGAVSLRAKFPTTQIEVFTVGCPRVGNSAFAEYYNSVTTRSVRWTNFEDPIPLTTPIGDRFIHVHDSYTIDVTLGIERTKDPESFRERTVTAFQDVNLRDPIFGHHLALYLSRLLDIFGSPVVPITV